LVALVAQDEIISVSGQVEPPGIHMIYLPYSEDIREIKELHLDETSAILKATDDQISKATALRRRVDLKDFSVCQFVNPTLQRHYAVLQTLALDEDEMSEIKDETLHDEEGMGRLEVINALEEFKNSVYGENCDFLGIRNLLRGDCHRPRVITVITACCNYCIVPCLLLYNLYLSVNSCKLATD